MGTDKKALDRVLELVRVELEQVEKEIKTRLASKVSLIRDVASYLMEGGGKRVRPALHLLSYKLCGGHDSRAVPIAAALEFLHNATLLHDDVVDGANLRRGKEAANLKFGNQQSVLTGDYLVTRVFNILVEDGDLELLSLIAETSARMAEGEALELSLPSPEAVDEKHYLEVVTEKTAVLFGASCAAGAIVAGAGHARQALWDYGVNFGIAFQLVDDLLDYLGTKERLGKRVGGDLLEGKMTLPLLLALKSGDGKGPTILEKVSKGEIGQEEIETAIDLIRRTGSDKATLDRARKYSRLAIASLDPLPEGEERKALKDLAWFCVERSF